jgi:large subunit ribosomal protein L24
MKIKQGDQIIVISGKEKGKTGKVMRTIAEKSRVVIEGLNMRKKHIKKSNNQPGEIVTFEASMHVSNVALVDPKTKKATRVGYKYLDSGKKTRVAKKSGQELK